MRYPPRTLPPRGLLFLLCAALAGAPGCSGPPAPVVEPAPKATPKEEPKVTLKEAPKEPAPETPKPTPKESPKEPIAVAPKLVVNPLDWPEMRGPEQNGVARDKNLPDSFSPDPNDKDGNLIWKQPFGGRSTPVVMNGRVFVINPTTEGVSAEERLHLEERVMCFDADNGKVLWEHKFPIFHTDIVAARVGWTSVVGDPETDNVYAHGVQGLLFCFEGKTGKVLWQKSLTEE
ncbi:MAG TPA: PQQ-binding-like beta-propeller repeat protein, partial [Gemmataceae bacterium]|nr:PQQ-binding-like beta-propeller repeat protein [Gemmataceae bacterium]